MMIALGDGKKMTEEIAKAPECARGKSAAWLTISK